MNQNAASDRLLAEIEQLALISEQAPPVVTRVLFSEADLRARDFVKELCREAGLSLREDAVGNVFARWTGSNPDAAPVATGSHIDAIPNAGKFDGVVGVLGALAAVRALRQAGFNPTRSIECILFTAEEPTRFGLGCLGSRILAGTLDPEKIQALRDVNGKDLQYWRAKAGLPDGNPADARLAKNCYAAFVELHIEQGPLLEERGLDIGVVERIAAPAALKLELTGVGGHAGAVLMPDRHDALLAGAEIALAVERAALSSGSPDTVATTGVFRIEPGAVNSVPCQALLQIDVRDTQLASRDETLRCIERAAQSACRKRGVVLQLEMVNADAPAVCDPDLVGTIESVCQDLGYASERMVSRAYHDTLFMAQVCPVTMIFIPCRGGVSHRPDEFSSPGQIAAGVAVLAETLRRLAA